MEPCITVTAITVVKDRRKPLKAGTLLGMCKQLGIDPSKL